LGALPAAQAPQLCQLVTSPPETDDWLSEIKFDGYRFIVSLDHGRVRLLTRKGLDWADRLPHIAKLRAGDRPSRAQSGRLGRASTHGGMLGRRAGSCGRGYAGKVHQSAPAYNSNEHLTNVLAL
jgi:hypothetical protein